MTQRLRILMLAVLAPIVAFASVGQAHAATRVLGLNVDGEKLSPKDRADLFAVLQAKLRLYPEVELRNPPEGEVTDDMIELECIDLDATCLARLGTKYLSDRVVHVEVKQEARRFAMRVRYVDVAQAKVTRDKEVRADKVGELAGLLEADVEAVFGKPPPPIVKGTLVVEVDSPDAVIQLGADYLGTGTATTDLPPGEYTVRISQVGFEDIITKLVVKSGETTQESFRMTALGGGTDPGKKKPDDDDDSLDWVVWAVVGAVVVGGAITAVVLATGGEDDVARGAAVLGIDGSGAWRDPATIGGRR